jgi:hemerythrin-like domain-containing protein
MQLNHNAPKTNVTTVLVEEHQLILRMIALLEKNVALAEVGRFSDWSFFLDEALPFIKDFADLFHHAKEEDMLFKALVANGMPREHSPVAAMLMEHDQGRSFVRGMELAARQLLASEPAVATTEVVASLAENARGYAALLREHLEKEDTILYPLAERVLPESVRPAMIAAYAAAEAKFQGLQEKYRRLVDGYEAKRTD